MSRVSDLVQDAELHTRFDSECTVHIYVESGQMAHERTVVREEHWKRGKFIGGGSYGSVWLEQCVSEHGEVQLRAIKQVLKSPNASNQLDYARELEAISKFSHRKYERCFVKSYGWFENEHAIFIAMEYFKHGDLQQFLRSAQPFPETEAQQITFQLLEGLHFMHTNGYSHRDVKPGNILIRSEPPDPWWVKLSDFGISKRAADNFAASSTVKGTLRYMAPELLGFVTSKGVPHARKAQAADMWALGEIAFQMLTLKPSFEPISLLASYARSPERFPSPILVARNVSEAGISFIRHLMHPKPDKRQTTAQALQEDWMIPFRSETPIRTLSTAIETSLNVTDATLILGDSMPAPSGRWSTVSMLPPQSQPASDVHATSVAQFRTVDHMETISEIDTVTPNTAPSVDLAYDTLKSYHPLGQARYYIMKSYNETNIETSAAHGIWCCNPNTNTRLSNAFQTSGPIYLIFSVNGSRKFCGVAEMKSPWRPDVTAVHWEDGTWKGGFLVKWLSFTSIEFDDVSHLKHKEDESGVSITRGRFVIELCANTGREMMRRFGLHEPISPRTQRSNDLSTVGSLGASRLNLETTTGMNIGFSFNSAPNHDNDIQQNDSISVTSEYNIESEVKTTVEDDIVDTFDSDIEMDNVSKQSRSGKSRANANTIYEAVLIANNTKQRDHPIASSSSMDAMNNVPSTRIPLRGHEDGPPTKDPSEARKKQRSMSDSRTSSGPSPIHQQTLQTSNTGVMSEAGTVPNQFSQPYRSPTKGHDIEHRMSNTPTLSTETRNVLAKQSKSNTIRKVGNNVQDIGLVQPNIRSLRVDAPWPKGNKDALVEVPNRTPKATTAHIPLTKKRPFPSEDDQYERWLSKLMQR